MIICILRNGSLKWRKNMLVIKWSDISLLCINYKNKCQLWFFCPFISSFISLKCLQSVPVELKIKKNSAGFTVYLLTTCKSALSDWVTKKKKKSKYCHGKNYEASLFPQINSSYTKELFDWQTEEKTWKVKSKKHSFGQHRY